MSLLKPVRSCPFAPQCVLPKRGFALVVALGLMAFVLLLVLAMSTLMRVETGISANQKQLTQARQNALLGVQLALGTLQKEMGPDRRISATASILDADPSTTEIDAVAQPHWTGAWNSFDWDRASEPSFAISGLADASDGKPARFRGWLVSGFSDTELSAADQLDVARLFTAQSPDAVQLVGEGTLGTPTLAQTDSVYARREAIIEDTTSLEENGYAFWVGDEGVKARIGNAVIEEPTTTEDKFYAVSVMHRPNLQALDGWEDFSGAEDSATRVFDYGGVEAVAVEDLDEEGAFNGKYHSVTPYSAGLLTDVRFGGFKKDLSTLFSGNGLPDGYDDEPMFELGDAKGVNWEFAKRFHNRYRFLEKQSDGTAYFDPLVFADELKPEKDYHASSPDTSTYGGVAPAPVVVRFQYVFSLFKGYNTIDGRPLADEPDTSLGMPLHSNDKILYLMVTPIVYLWNPYNVAINMDLIEDGHSALNLLPGEPPIEISIDGGVTYTKWSEMFAGYAGEMLSMNTSNTERGTGGFVIPPGMIYINTLTNRETVGGPLLRRGSFLSAPNLQGVFGEEHIDEAMGDGLFTWFNRKQYMVEGYDPSRMGFYTPVIKPPLPGGEMKDRKVLAAGTTNIRIRATTPAYDGDRVRFLFKTSLGGEDQVDERRILGMTYMKADGMATPKFIEDEYTFPEPIQMSGNDVPDMFVGDQFVGATPHFSLYYDLRVFEETDRLGMPGLFSDPINGYFYSEDANDQSIALAPFSFYFETLAGGNLIEFPPDADADDNLAAFKNESSDLVSRIVAKELPLGPSLSIAQLQHAPLGLDSSHHVYTYHNLHSEDVFEGIAANSDKRRNMATVYNRAVGNSFAHPMLSADSIWDGGVGIDRSYLLNDLLFDSYFFSGVADQGGVFTNSTETAGAILEGLLSGDYEFQNTNFRLSIPKGMDTQSISDEMLSVNTNELGGAFEKLAALISVDGAFNVNSTSVDAWAAMLSSQRDQAVMYEQTSLESGGYVDGTNEDLTPVLSQSVPAAPAVAQSGSDPNALYQALWSGFRSLTDAQIRSLAEAIVAEVKSRGPFLSLGQFINREISDRSAFNQQGAVQSAMEQASINTASEDSGLQGALEKRFNSNIMDSGEVSSVGFMNEDALEGNDVNTGLAGFLTQADMLKPMAPLLTPRTDTFVIRSYGDVKRGGNVLVRVWCEAVVQRRANYVEGNGPSLMPWDLPGNNSTESIFGREFRVLSFRWLDADEV